MPEANNQQPPAPEAPNNIEETPPLLEKMVQEKIDAAERVAARLRAEANDQRARERSLQKQAPSSFANLPKASDEQNIVRQFSAQEKKAILASISSPESVPKIVQLRMRQFDIVRTILDEALAQIEQPKTFLGKFAATGDWMRNTLGMHTPMRDKQEQLKGEIQSFYELDYPGIVHTLLKGQTTIEQMVTQHPLLQRAVTKYQLKLPDPRDERDLLDQEIQLLSFLRGSKNYDAAARLVESVLQKEFLKGEQRISKERKDELRYEAAVATGALVARHKEQWRNPSPALRNQGAMPMTEEDVSRMTAGMQREKMRSLLNAEIAKNFDSSLLTGAKRKMWNQYNDMLDPQGEWDNLSDTHVDVILEEIAINAPLIIASGGVASLARAGMTAAGRSIARRLVTEIVIQGGGKLTARQAITITARKTAAWAGGTLVEGATFEAMHSALSGQLPKDLPEWSQRILWSSATLGLFHGAGNVGDRVVKTGILKNSFAKITSEPARKAAELLLVKGHIEAAAMLVMGAAQNGATIGSLDEFYENFSEELLHAYVTVGALKIGHASVKTVTGKIFKPEGKKAAGEETGQETPIATQAKEVGQKKSNPEVERDPSISLPARHAQDAADLRIAYQHFADHPSKTPLKRTFTEVAVDKTTGATQEVTLEIKFTQPSTGIVDVVVTAQNDRGFTVPVRISDEGKTVSIATTNTGKHQGQGLYSKIMRPLLRNAKTVSGYIAEENTLHADRDSSHATLAARSPAAAARGDGFITEIVADRELVSYRVDQKLSSILKIATDFEKYKDADSATAQKLQSQYPDGFSKDNLLRALSLYEKETTDLRPEVRQVLNRQMTAIEKDTFAGIPVKHAGAEPPRFTLSPPQKEILYDDAAAEQPRFVERVTPAKSEWQESGLMPHISGKRTLNPEQRRARDGFLSLPDTTAGLQARLQSAHAVLPDTQWTTLKEEAVLLTHQEVVMSGTAADGSSKYSKGDLYRKMRVLEEGGFSHQEADTLIRMGICGNIPPPPPPTSKKLNIPKYEAKIPPPPPTIKGNIGPEIQAIERKNAPLFEEFGSARTNFARNAAMLEHYYGHDYVLVYIQEAKKILRETDDVRTQQSLAQALSVFMHYRIRSDGEVTLFCDHLLESFKKHPEKIKMILRGNVWGMRKNDVGIGNLEVECIGSQSSSKNIHRLLLMSRKVATLDANKFEQNRLDGLALMNFRPLRDIIHNGNEGVHDLVAAMTHYYRTNDRAPLEKALSFHEKNGLVPTYREGYFDRSAYEKTVSVEDAAGDIKEMKRIKILERVEKNTVPQGVNIPEVRDQTMAKTLHELHKALDSRNEAAMEKNIAEINDAIQKRINEGAPLDREFIQIIAHADDAIYLHLKDMSYETALGQVRKEWFLQMLRFQSLVHSKGDKDINQFLDTIRNATNPRVAWKLIFDDMIDNVADLAKMHREDGRPQYIDMLWSGNVIHELITPPDARRAETRLGERHKKENEGPDYMKNTGD